MEKRYNKVGEYDYGHGIIAYDPNMDETSKSRELAKFRHRFGKINGEELEYELLDLAHIDKNGEDYRRSRLRLDLRFRRISDEEYERSNLLITYPDDTSEDAVRAMFKHDFKHGKITDEQYDHSLLDLKFDDHESIEYKLAQLDLEKKHGNITENEWEKETATILKEPWFNIMGADQRAGATGSTLAIELDWNEFFPRFLETQGWTGHSDDEIVDRWFEEAMRQMVDPGLSDEQMDAMEDEDYMPPRGTKRRRNDDGRTEYS
jgi:hypothetical protein